jgi:clan AA aspartic protease
VIRGQVTPDREANFFLTIEGTAGQREQMEVTVDTGFNGFLTIPPAVVTRLALPIRAPTQATLADGTTVQLDVVEVTVIWDGRPRTIAALSAEGGSLVGMSLLYGHRLTVDVVDGGRMTIRRIP